MKKPGFIFFLFFCSVIFLNAQDLPGYKKLRGDILASPPEDAYTTHAYNAFDTNKNTCYKSSATGGWIGLDLKVPYKIAKVRIYPRADRAYRMDNAIIQGANNPDFNNAVNLYTITQTPAANQFTTYSINSEHSFRYVRCLAQGHACNMAEVEFYTEEEGYLTEYKQLTNLPTIYLETGGNFDFKNKEEYIPSKVIVVDGNNVKSSEAGIKGRGNSTWEFEKKPFRIKFDKKQRFMGLTANAKSWTLIASHVDKTFMRNGVTFAMSRFLDFEFTPGCVYVDVVLDGFYYGTFFVSDQIQVGANRIDIDEMVPEDSAQPELTGGYHLEVDGYAKSEPVYFTTIKGVDVTIKSPDWDVITSRQKSWISSHVNKMEDLLYKNPEQACEKYIDIESAVKYYLISEISANCDAFWCFHLYKKRGDDKLYFGPVWDFDQGYGNDGRVERYSSVLDVNFGFKQWFPIIMQTKAAREALKRIWAKAIEEDLEQQMLDYIRENAFHIQASQALNYQRWNSLNRYIFTNTHVYNTYEEYIGYLEQFIKDRFEWYNEYITTIVADKKVFLSTSKSNNEKITWKYTTQNPNNPYWHWKSYSDSKWQTGKAPFGTVNGWSTAWKTNEIYLRTTFNVEEEDIRNLEKLYLEVFHDEDCWIYINNRDALQCSGYLTGYKTFEINKSLLNAGENLIAIKCTQTDGGQMIDCGVYGTLTDITSSINTQHENNANITYWIADNVLLIKNLNQGAKVEVYSINGQLLTQQFAVNTTVNIPLKQKGVYIVQVEGKSLKVVF